jgi:malonyl-CoA decarboxylase
MTDTLTASPSLPVEELEWREITSDCSEAVKEKLVDKERVHRFRAGQEKTDLVTHRLAAPTGKVIDKHCFGLFVEGEEDPQIVVYVRLYDLPEENGKVANKDLPGDIRDILDGPPRSLEAANTAIFYTITNMKDPKLKLQLGNQSLGETLIRQTAAKLAERYGIMKFSTLSPLRVGMEKEAKGFAQWVEDKLSEQEKAEHILTSQEHKGLCLIAGEMKGKPVDNVEEAFGVLRKNQFNLRGQDLAFFQRLCQDLTLFYLAVEKQNNRVIDSVADFHLRNGGQIAKLQVLDPALSTPSETLGGLNVMVNYAYDFDRLDRNKERYRTGEVDLDPNLETRLAARLKKLAPHSSQAAEWLAHQVPHEHGRAV